MLQTRIANSVHRTGYFMFYIELNTRNSNKRNSMPQRICILKVIYFPLLHCVAARFSQHNRRSAQSFVLLLLPSKSNQRNTIGDFVGENLHATWRRKKSTENFLLFSNCCFPCCFLFIVHSISASNAQHLSTV